MPTQKFATHFLWADTQENFTYMDLDFSKQKDKKLSVIEKTKTSFINYETITYLECDGNLVFVFHTHDKSPYSYTNSLIKLESELTECGFLRISHNKLVNMYHVMNLNSKKHEIQLSDGNILTVSRRKWQKIRNIFSSK